MEINTAAEVQLTYEAALEKLQQTVKSIEAGDLSLEQALKKFEEGVQLIRVCQQQLAVAEQKVETLTQRQTAAPSN